MQRSEWDKTPLPGRWNRIAPYSKVLIIAYLQHRHNDPVPCWENMEFKDRRAAVMHLCAVGSVSARTSSRVRSYGLATMTATRKAESSKSHMMADLETSYVTFQPTQRQGMLYPSPNGGKRILPSAYTKLTDRWLRANGVYNRPEMMNQGHLKNCVALLNESHVNFVGKASHMLGKIHAHLVNRPDLQDKLVELFHEFEKLEVDELYPIVELLASHIELEEDDIVFNEQDFDTPDLDKW